MAIGQPAISTRDELIEHTSDAWDRYVIYVDGLTDDQWLDPRDHAGWSVRDHVAHVTQWDIAVVELFRNETPMQQTLGVSDADWAAEDYDAMNEVYVAAFGDHRPARSAVAVAGLPRGALVEVEAWARVG